MPTDFLPDQALGADPAAMRLHPRMQTFYDYWRRIHPAGGGLPGRQHFDPLQIHSLLPNLWLVDVVGQPARFRYRLMGTRHVSMFGADFTGRWLDEVHLDFDQRPGLGDRIRHVVATTRPTWRRAAPVMRDANWAEVESMIVPMAKDGINVDLLVCMSIWFGRDGREA